MRSKKNVEDNLNQLSGNDAPFNPSKTFGG